MAQLDNFAANEVSGFENSGSAPQNSGLSEDGKLLRLELPLGVKMDMVWCPPDTFIMGSPPNELGRPCYLPANVVGGFELEVQHRVTLTKGFWMAKYAVTQEQYKVLVGDVPSEELGMLLPVENVTWDEAVAFCVQLSQYCADMIPSGYRVALPTEAQWEYACRAGTVSALNSGQELSSAVKCRHLDKLAWYSESRQVRLSEVGLKQPNAWGLYDMHGNVWEWCADWLSEYAGDAVDPVGPVEAGGTRAIRGGTYYSDAYECRSAYRRDQPPGHCSSFVGFRPVCSAPIASGNKPVSESRSHLYALSGYLSRAKANDGVAIVDAASVQVVGGNGEAVSETSNCVVEPLTAGHNGSLWLPGKVELELVWCPSGIFKTGTGSRDARYFDHLYEHKVTLTKGFWMAKYALTQAQYEAITGNNPSQFKGSRRPVEHVNWYEAYVWCRQASASCASSLPGNYCLMLPTEAQWEYACRAGTTSDINSGQSLFGVFGSSDNIDQVAWYIQNSECQTHEVGQKLPNAWGIYDMHGNVKEWCLDWFGNYPHETSDPAGPYAGKYGKIARGGSFNEVDLYCTSSHHGNQDPGIADKQTGFRPVCAVGRDTAEQALARPRFYSIGENLGSAWGEGTDSLPVRDVDSVQLVEPERIVSKTSEPVVEPLTIGRDGSLWLPNRVELELVWCSPGTFVMGGDGLVCTELDCRENYQSRVTLTKGFWMAKYPVTQEQYEAITGSNPSQYKGRRRPVEQVNWEEAVDYAQKTSKYCAGNIPNGYKLALPTQAQWEYVCRAGTCTTYNCGQQLTDGRNSYANLDRVAWYKGNSGLETHNVGQKLPNAWGLCDMHGNVREWCLDMALGSWLVENEPNDDEVTYVSLICSHILRGGGWRDDPRVCGSATQTKGFVNRRYDNVGFRLACRTHCVAFGKVVNCNRKFTLPTCSAASAAGEPESNSHIYSLAGAAVLGQPQEADSVPVADVGSVKVGDRNVNTVVKNGQLLTGALALGQNGSLWLPNNTELKLVWCPPGTFTMGSPGDEVGRDYNETQHQATLTKGFWMAKYALSQYQYETVVASKPSWFEEDYRPVEQVTWTEAVAFCDRLTELCHSNLPSGYRLALPTEAQWEYACRAGTASAINYVYENNTRPRIGGDLGLAAWYRGNSGGATHKLGLKLSNAWGLLDMLGNVWEWCTDWFGEYQGNVTDPVGPSTGSRRVVRGGAWDSEVKACRAAGRYDLAPNVCMDNIGFRVACRPIP